MNSETFENFWKKFKREKKRRYAKVSDADIHYLEMEFERMAGLLVKKN